MNEFLAKHFEKGVIVLLILAALINLIGAFGPELGFDALWYHLTLVKLYLLAGKIYFVPGGLLYYSAMPRLGELLFLFPVKFFSEVGAHLVSWGFGLVAATFTYLLARKFLPKKESLVAAAIFYVTPLVGWQSGSAYVDLIRTAFEIAAVYFIFEKKYWISGLALGLAISTKTLALGSVPILVILAFYLDRDWKNLVKLLLPATLISFPWFWRSFQNTGFPFYPVGAGILDSTHGIFPGLSNPLTLVGDLFKLFVFPQDYISPLFILFIPIMLLVYKKLNRKEVCLVIFFLLSYIVWWCLPRTGGGRFILPYLPVWAVLIMVCWSKLPDLLPKKLLLVGIAAITIFNLLYRTAAVSRLTPYLTGKISKTDYLCSHLDFSTSVFVDCDGWFSKNIKPSDLVLVAGVHNLFYVDFPFVHETWWKGENYNYILVQNNIPAESVNHDQNKLRLVYQNNQTKLKMYKII